MSLPKIQTNDSADAVKKFFNTYYSSQVNYTVEEVDATIGYFKKRGFSETSAISTASIILQQAKVDRVDVAKLLDTLNGLSDVQLSNIVAQILNSNRSKTSQLGYKIVPEGLKLEQRNIVV